MGYPVAPQAPSEASGPFPAMTVRRYTPSAQVLVSNRFLFPSCIRTRRNPLKNPVKFLRAWKRRPDMDKGPPARVEGEPLDETWRSQRRFYRIGQIVPSSNTTMETEIPAMLRVRESI